MGQKTQSSKDAINLKHERTKAMFEIAKDLPRREFEPLKSWPVARHPEQDRLDEFRAIKSAYNRI